MATGISDGPSVNSKIFTNTTLTDATANAIYVDPYYGLNNVNNYAKWDALLDNADELVRRLFKNELRTYFGLSQAQVDQAELNWNTLWQSSFGSFTYLMLPAGHYDI